MQFDPKSRYDGICLPDCSRIARPCWEQGSAVILDFSSFLPARCRSFLPWKHSLSDINRPLVAAGAGVLLAAPFDVKTNRAGDFDKVLDDLRTTFLYGAQYALSDTESLLYAAEARATRGGW